MIIFDLGGVLLHEAEINLLHALPADLDIELIHNKPPRIFNRMFEFANLIFNKDCKRDWIIGNISGHEIVQKIKETIDTNEFDFFFKNKQERNLIKHGSELILLPEKLVMLTQLNQDGFEFVKKCKRNGIRILFLSNWDPESFVLIKDKFQELFRLCNSDDIVIPAQIGFIKPDLRAFDYMIKSLKCDITKTFFVDDSSTNVAAAQKYGITSILHQNWKQTAQELIQKGLIFPD